MLLTDNPARERAPQQALAPALPTATIAWIVLAFLAPFLLYFPTAQSFVQVWNSSETFAHGYIIAPISAWLIWRRRANFSALPPSPWWPALALVLLAGAGWMVARMGEVQVVMQYAFAAMFPAIALGIFGRRLAWSFAFPLLFLLFAVPFGEIFIQPLIEFTADFTVWAVQATGIPVLRNGTRFELPTGSWSVVEACSGVRYLISSVTIGSLYAYLTYRSTLRRGVFVIMSILVPILANGLRAYLIVMIGHTSNMELATGVDHLIYGWLFFGLVMFAMFWVGSYWRQDTDAESDALVRAAATDVAAPGRIRNMALAIVAACALWPAFTAVNARATHNPKPAVLAAVPVSWARAAAFSTWAPSYAAPDATFNGVYQLLPEQSPQQAALPPVALTILYYRNQTRDKSLISSTNRMAGEKDAYHEADSAMRLEQVAGKSLGLIESSMQGPSGSFLVWRWIAMNGNTFTNAYVGKLHQAKTRLMFGGDDGAAVMVYAPYSDKNPEPARKALRAFLDANLSALDSTLATAGSN